jgi:excisionase family DNA binding protein
MSHCLLKAEEVAKILNVDRQRVYELARTNQLPTVVVGARQYRWSSAVVNRWIENGGSRKGGNEENDSK